jgi:hypothetical protein
VTPYHKNWVCVIDGDNLDAELPQLKIGKSAVALFQQDIERFRAAMKQAAGGEEGALSVGDLSRLDAPRWESVVKDFFQP